MLNLEWIAIRHPRKLVREIEDELGDGDANEAEDSQDIAEVEDEFKDNRLDERVSDSIANKA